MYLENKIEHWPSSEGALAHRLQRRTACKIQNGRQGAQKWPTGSGKFLDPSTPSMRKVDDGEKKKVEKKEKREKNVIFSGHYVIANSLPPERRPLERRTLVPIYSLLE